MDIRGRLMERIKSTLCATIALALFGSCGATSLGETHHKASLGADLELTRVQIEVISDAERVANPDQLPGPRPASSPLASGTVREPNGQEWGWELPRFAPKTELVLDLGVGEVPFDDGVQDYGLDFRPVRGFSDALMQLELRALTGPGVSWHGIAAMNRIQEETLMDALDQADWAWFGVGIQFSW